MPRTCTVAALALGPAQSAIVTPDAWHGRASPVDPARLAGAHAGARILLDVTDAPFLLLMEPALRRLTAHRRSAAPRADAEIRGKLRAFLAMLHGGEDGDALFFSGELEIAGDTSVVLALRNALDDAELDLTEELVAEVGRAGPLLRGAARTIARQSGLTLTRQGPWHDGTGLSRRHPRRPARRGRGEAATVYCGFADETPTPPREPELLA